MSSRIADILIPPRCGDMIRTGALVAVNTSGGKDSQAMTILLSRIVPHGQLVAVHAPLGEVEWQGTSISSARFSPACHSFWPLPHPERPCSNASRSGAGGGWTATLR